MADIKDSIFESVKKLVNAEGDDYFDTDLLIHINTVFSVLTQLGVGPADGFEVDKETLWSEYTNNIKAYNMLKSYVVLEVRILFDMPSSSFMLETMKEKATELEWRIATEAELREMASKEEL